MSEKSSASNAWKLFAYVSCILAGTWRHIRSPAVHMCDATLSVEIICAATFWEAAVCLCSSENPELIWWPVVSCINHNPPQSMSYPKCWLEINSYSSKLQVSFKLALACWTTFIFSVINSYGHNFKNGCSGFQIGSFSSYDCRKKQVLYCFWAHFEVMMTIFAQ